MPYAGNISPTEAWELLKGDARAQLVDVRTAAEWNFVGLPDLSELGRAPILVEWQTAAGRNPEFEATLAARLTAAGVARDTPLAFLCRSGARSQAAAIAMTEAGYSKCFNVAEGFEGGLNGARHRGQEHGWKAEGLAWFQS
jgi:rhodanese-related sulfurtransferase